MKSSLIITGSLVLSSICIAADEEDYKTTAAYKAYREDQDWDTVPASPAKKPLKTPTKDKAQSGKSNYFYYKTPEPKDDFTKFPQAIQDLLKSEDRPTIAQFIEAMDKSYGSNWRKEKNPFSTGWSTRVTDSANSVANVIVSLEKAYPGATYYPLGRDVVLLGDIVDAFYLSLNQPGRIHRLDASGTSFPNYYGANEKTFEKDRYILNGFMKTNGIDVFENSPVPQIMFDVTSWRTTSQSRQLIRAVYQTFSNAGGNPKDLFNRVNFIGIPMGFSNGATIRPELDVENYKAIEQESITDEGPDHPLFLDGDVTARLTYTDAWHPMFEKFVPKDNDTVVTSIPASTGFEKSSRPKLLGELFEAITTVQTLEFLERVRNRSLYYGYEFPTTRSLELKRVQPPSDPPKPKQEAKTTTRFGSIKDAFLASVAQSADPIYTALFFIEDVRGMWSRNSVSALDVAELFDSIESKVDITNKKFKKEAMNILLGEPKLKKLLFKRQKKSRGPAAKCKQILLTASDELKK